MLLRCPHCQKDLNFNDGQGKKIQVALRSLKKGVLKLGCPFCKQSIHLYADGSVVEKRDISKSMSGNTGRISPPAFPDISWMTDGICDEGEVAEDVLKSLLLMPEGEVRDKVGKVFAELGYQTIYPESAGDAIEQMRFVNFAAVVFQVDSGGEFKKSEFHHNMTQMSMSGRRRIYYVLIGPGFRTLYDLEALAYSANLVVNEVELPYFDIILKKGMQDRDELFGSYISALATG